MPTIPFTIPILPNGDLPFELELGEVMFVLGANGTGKSSLMHRLFVQHPATAYRIHAHRQNWMQSGGIGITPQGRANIRENVRNHDQQGQARWKDDYGAARTDAAIFDLVDSENVRARAIAKQAAIEVGAAAEMAKAKSPIGIINELLRLSNLRIVLEIAAGSEVMARKAGVVDAYSIAKLSDGERNAVLIASEVLTKPEGTLILIDEPERHLHRSIISPLLSLLVKARPDCRFVISTHDVMIPIDNPKSKVLLLRESPEVGLYENRWNADLVEDQAQMPEDVKQEILGGRQRMLFVEGIRTSLDTPLYALVFPHLTVVPRGSCRAVEQAVAGIRGAHGLHWLQVWGLIDNDRRTPDDMAALRARDVFALALHSVESIYYHPEVQRLIARRQAAVLPMSEDDLVRRATDRAIAAVQPESERLAIGAVEKTVRSAMMALLPKHADIRRRQPIQLSLPIDEYLTAELARIDGFLQARDVGGLVNHYKLRATPAFSRIAEALGFGNSDVYEGAVIKMLSEDPGALAVVQGFFSDLIAETSRPLN